MTSGPLPVSPTTNSTLLWDGENRLTEVKNAAGTTIEKNIFDSGSRKIATTANGITTLYFYDGWNCIAEYQGDTGVTPVLKKIRLWGTDLSGSMQGAGGVGGMLSESSPITSNPITFNSSYPTYDGNGNVSEYLDSTGQVIAHFEYDPFGNTVVNTDTSNQFSYRFSTKLIAFATGLYYYGYRYYDPLTGRWPSRDPIGAVGGPKWFDYQKLREKYRQMEINLGKYGFLARALELMFLPSEHFGQNLYAFVKNEPIQSSDYLGLDVYKINRKLGAKEGQSNTARSRNNPVSHTFVAVEHKDGSVDTYSWGNTDNPTGWNKNKGEDKEAYKEAKEEGKAEKVHDGHDKDQEVEDAYQNGKDDPNDNHRNGLIANNCKAESDELLEEAGIDPFGGAPNPLNSP